MIMKASISDKKTCSKLEMIYNAYSDAMYYRAYAILHNKCDAEDAVHGAFIKILDNMDKLNEPTNPKTRSFVLIVVENTAIDIYRKRKRLGEIALEDFVQDFAEQYSYHRGNMIMEQILKMQPKYRNVLMLKYIYGYNYAEIGQIMDIKEDTAKKIGQRAKASLQKMCEELGML